MFILQILKSEANWFILKLDNIEAKRTGSIVSLVFKKQSTKQGSQALVSLVIPTNAKLSRFSVILHIRVPYKFN